jgi:hypothetical protein
MKTDPIDNMITSHQNKSKVVELLSKEFISADKKIKT